MNEEMKNRVQRGFKGGGRMNGAGGVNEIWGKDGGEREIGGGEKNFCNWQRGRGGKRKGERRKKY